MSVRRTVLIYALLLFYTVAPILSVIIASGVASLCGARLDEGDVHPCLLWGHDIGGVLYSMFVFGWFGLATIPTGVLTILAFSAKLVIDLRRDRREKRLM